MREEVRGQSKQLQAIWEGINCGQQLPEREVTGLKGVSLPLTTLEEIEKLLASLSASQGEQNAMVCCLQNLIILICYLQLCANYATRVSILSPLLPVLSNGQLLLSLDYSILNFF